MMNTNMMNMLMQIMNGGNPQQMVQGVLQRNPQINAILQQQKQSGLSMEQYVKQLAQQRGVDIQPMVNNLRQRGMKF